MRLNFSLVPDKFLFPYIMNLCIVNYYPVASGTRACNVLKRQKKIFFLYKSRHIVVHMTNVHYLLYCIFIFYHFFFLINLCQSDKSDNLIVCGVVTAYVVGMRSMIKNGIT